MVGYVELFLGPMYSGKSTALIEAADQYELCNKKVLMVNHASDNRYGDSGVYTHGKHKKDAVMVGSLTHLIENDIISDYDVVCVDEIQFFDDLNEFVKKAVANQKVVVMSGLVGQYTLDPFESVCKLIPFADKITFMRSLCMSCKDGTKASFNKKLVIDAPDVGGYGTYLPVCRCCYEKL